MKSSQRAALERLASSLAVSAPASGQIFDPGELFDDRPSSIGLEIGFGGGEHLADVAARRPNWGLLGVEPYANGVAKLFAACERRDLRNVRVVMDDARLVLASLKPGSIAAIWTLFPDPWPKARHKKRRIVDSTTISAMAFALRPGGELRLATDDVDYGRVMLEAALDEPRLEWTARRAADWRAGRPSALVTRYEAKALAAGRHCLHLDFRRR